MGLPEIVLTDREIYEALAIRTNASKVSNRAQKQQRKSHALNLSKTLFDQQVEFIEDESKRKAAI